MNETVDYYLLQSVIIINYSQSIFNFLIITLMVI